MLNGPDVVTIGLYTLETAEGEYHRGFLKQSENIQKIVEGLTEAANRNGKPAPKFVLSVLMVPNWQKPENGFSHDSYQETKSHFITETKEHFEKIGVTVQDFLEEGQLTPADLEYMTNLTATGSVADIIKTRAIINNQHVPHLQLDSNTIISNFDKLYEHTFARELELQRDGLNACYYRNTLAGHLDAHNKAVYTTPGGKVAGALAKTYAEYVERHKDDQHDKKNNNIYENVFGPALHSVGLTFENVNVTRMTKFYPPEINQPEYEMTQFIVTAVNMSWTVRGNVNPQIEALKNVQPLPIEDARCDFQSFSYIVKKYSEYLKKNASESTPPNVFFAKFLDITDNQFNMRLLAEYYQYIRQTQIELLPTLASSFPNTPKGNILVKTLFGCHVEELHAEPQRDCLEVLPHDITQMNQQLIENDNEALEHYVRRSPNYLTDAYVTRLFSGNSAEKSHQEFVAAIKEKQQDELMEQPQYHVIANVYQFFSAIENGLDGGQVLFLLQNIAEQDRDIFSQVKEAAVAMLINSNDNRWHFNYIPNRQENLQVVGSFEPLARERSVQMIEPVNDRRPRALTASYNRERSRSPEKLDALVSRNDVTVQQDEKKEVDVSNDGGQKRNRT